MRQRNSSRLDGKTGFIDGIKYAPIDGALRGPHGDGNGIISGYNCRHRLIAYAHGSKPPTDFSEAEINKEYAIDKQQRSYENRIRQMKTQERILRAAEMTNEAVALRKRWRRLTADYEIFSIEHKRAFYRYRCVIDRAEVDEAYEKEYVRLQNQIGKENMPKSIDNFREMKDNNSEEYIELKVFADYKKDNNASTIKDYRHSVQLQKDGIKGKIHIPSQIVETKSFSYNEEHINKERNHKVNSDEARSYIKDSLISITQWKGRRVVYYSEKGAVCIDLQTKKIVTAYKPEEFDEKVKKILEVIKEDE